MTKERESSQVFEDHGLVDKDSIAEIEELIMRELQRIFKFKNYWDGFKLPFDRVVFLDTLDKSRGYRNRLMHFRDPLTEAEMTELSNFCDTVREIKL